MCSSLTLHASGCVHVVKSGSTFSSGPEDAEFAVSTSPMFVTCSYSSAIQPHPVEAATGQSLHALAFLVADSEVVLTACYRAAAWKLLLVFLWTCVRMPSGCSTLGLYAVYHRTPVDGDS